MTKDEIKRILLSSTSMSNAEAEALAKTIAALGGRRSSSSISSSGVGDKIDEELDRAVKGATSYNEAINKSVKLWKESLTEKQKNAEILNRLQRLVEEEYEVQKDINKELEVTEKRVRQEYELRSVTVKKIQEGLTLQEEINKKILEWGVKNGHNIDMMSKGLGEIKQSIGGISSGIKSIVDGSMRLVDSWGKVDQAAASYTKTIGGSAAGMERLRKSTIEFASAQQIGAKYNTSMVELIQLQEKYNSQLGRSIDLTNSQKENMAAMRSVMGDELTGQFTASLANFGMDPDKVADISGKMFSEASKKGISFDKYSKNMLNNIKMAQNYTFASGVEGLKRMAEQATKINLDMNQTARFAEKVSTLEGAMQAGAQLSVLGGSFAQYSNPLAMMNMGLNDMESLQNNIVGMFGGKARWDSSKGQISMDTFDRQRVKAASEATGMDYQAVMDMIFANERRNIVGKQLGSKFGNDKDFQELILNSAQLDKEGKAYVTDAQGNKKSLNEITEADKKDLQIAHNSDSDNIKDIAVRLRGWEDSVSGLKKQKETEEANLIEMSGVGERIKNIVQWMGGLGAIIAIPSLLGTISGMVGGILAAVGGVGGMFNGGKTMFNGLGFGGSGTIPGVTGGGGSGVGGGAGGVLKGKGGWHSFGGKNYQLRKDGNIYSGVGRNAKQVTDPNIVNAIKNGGGTTGTGTTGGAAKGLKGFSGFSAKGFGAGAVASVAGMGVDALTDGLSGERKGGGYVAGKIIGKALEWGGQGAMMGAMFGPWGALIGGGIGAIAGWYDSDKEKMRSQIAYDYGLNLNGDYDRSELKEIQEYLTTRKTSSNQGLRRKLEENGDKTESNVLWGFRKGGYTGDGNPNEVAGIVHKGEVVIPHEKIETLKAGNNSLSISKVSPNNSGGIGNKINIEPLKIDISGTIKLDLGNQTASINANDLLKNQGFINELSKKLQGQINMAYNKEGAKNRFSQTTI